MQRNTILRMAVPVALIALAATASKTFADDHDKKTVIQVSEPVQAPGGVVLQPGKYVLILLNSSSNRNIVEIRSEDASHLYATTFTTRANRVQRTGDVVVTYYEMPAGSPPALRQWFWPGDYDGQEFLYPHKQAQEISQASNQKVPELPEDQSANQPDAVSAAPAAPAAPAADSNAVASTETVNAAPPAQAPQTDASVSAQVDTSVSTQPSVQQDRQLAQVTPPADTNSTPAASPAVDQSSSQSSNADSALPQTASDLPLFVMFGFVSIALAIGSGLVARGRV